MTVSAVLRAGLGALAGGLAAALSAWLASTTGQAAPFVVLVVVAVAMIGLWLGVIPAIAAYAVAALAMLIDAVSSGGRSVDSADVVRLAAFAIGTPFVIMLAARAESRARESRRASDAAASVQRLASDERQAADAARGDLHAALDLVEQERSRLQE